ncbi:hypothetical protein BWQ96_02311 [Gracilariopsis chorda]|uniref:Uncharacterized protein n=1 Tax=Gracilariopsis chorda TaxID=448386 RepID=A0A2V3J0R5_9FLOR|nr:hypothetical protein BWQ96_02311 [Gracilariopsis chorda]|eukprot:PXF47925.1 hypothetical protein BWQ96_02311 [Gracilariopsis chorda]
MQPFVNRLRSNHRFLQLCIILLMLSNVAPTLPGVAALVLGYVFNHLEVGVLGFTLLQCLFGRPLASWSTSSKLFKLLCRIPSPSSPTAASHSQRARVVNNLITDAAGQNRSRLPCFGDAVSLSFLYLKGMSLTAHHFRSQLLFGKENDAVSFEQVLVRFPAACIDYNSNIGNFLHEEFLQQFHSLLFVRSLAETTSLARTKSSGQRTAQEEQVIHGDNQARDYDLVNNVESLRILFTIVLFQGLRNESDATEREARYWEALNQSVARHWYLCAI